ncbi:MULTISPECIES: phosphate ABC transporter substrate-binding protein [unclassified Pseudoalteromonas]|uniref:phosphate ABC transporter substrate-binding protein n=1 Tax=unclassified Pseudoalteromonas TaxID=194690 RepID=UPI000693E03B|nr:MULTISPECIES: phosphate ABC transporter substrate-binding protein [unclassified Pseudoalteromonas]
MRIKLLLISLMCCSQSTLASITVIVHPSNNNDLNKSAITRLFLGKTKKFPDGTIAIPLNQDESKNITEEFNSKALKKSSSQLKAYWSKLVFTGKGTPPKNAEDNKAVLDIVAQNPNVIGYIRSDIVNDKVKAVTTF